MPILAKINQTQKKTLKNDFNKVCQKKFYVYPLEVFKLQRSSFEVILNQSFVFRIDSLKEIYFPK